MTEMETLGILEEIGVLVTDRFQVVSYKWLSRNFLVSSNAAKKLLEEFVEKHEGGLEVVYSLAGWLKRSHPTYHIRLVPGPKLAEAKKDFDDNCSIQVYSVQACIPKDPAEIWNAEFVQAEELFRQPLTVTNCLRDNRFCGVSNSLVKRSADQIPVSISDAPLKPATVSGLSRPFQTNSTLQPQTKKFQQSGSKAGRTSSYADTGETAQAHDPASKPDTGKEKISLVTDKKKGQHDASSVRNGGSLANLWGCASTKPKGNIVSTEATNDASKIDVSAEAQIGVHEALEGGSDDDDVPDVNFKRTSIGESTKKRRVVLVDDSDEEVEHAVSLASPDPPKGRSSLNSEQKIKPRDPGGNIQDFEQGNDDPKAKGEEAKEEDENAMDFSQLLTKDSSTLNKDNSNRTAPSPNIYHSTSNDSTKQANVATSDDATKQSNVAGVTPTSPKRRKVLKTRIDERGREVSEVVWEGQETEIENRSSNVTKNADDDAGKSENNTRANHANSTAPTKKSAAVGSTTSSHPAGKAGNKKGGKTKDPKQGNILSFFKRG